MPSSAGESSDAPGVSRFSPANGRVVTVRDVREGVTDDGMIMTAVDRRQVPVVFEPVLTAAITR